MKKETRSAVLARRFVAVLALVCVSALMFGADPVTGSSTDHIDGSAFTNGYDYSFSTSGTSVTISFTEKENYTGLVAYLWNYTSGFAETGMSVSGHTASITLTGQTAGTTLDFACKFAYTGGMSVTKRFTYTVPADEGGGGDPDPEPERESECIGAKGHFGNPSAKHVYYQIDYVDSKAIISLRSLTGYDLDFAEVHIVGVGNYAMTADGNGGYTYTINNPTVNAEWYLRFLYSDTNMGGNEMTAENLNSSDANMVYYKVGACTSTETENANISLASAGASATASTGTASAAIDNNEGTRWESAQSDPQWICVDLGSRKVFNKVQLVHEGAYIKTYDIQLSDDGTNFTTIKHVSEVLGGSFPYTQNIDLGGKYAARYVRINGTERGTQYGYSLWELRILYATTPVLTTYTASIPSSFCVIGTPYQVSVSAKDQLGKDFPVETTFSVSPVGAGTITSSGVYTPVEQGGATITASGGGKTATVVVRNEVSADLALNQPATAGHNNENAYQSNNGNLGQRWGSNGATHYATDPVNFGDWWYVDLGAKYDISEIAIKWETARPNDYDIRVSDDASTWTNIGTFDSYPSNTEYEYYNSLSSVPGRYVGVWARNGYENLGWGISMWDFQVFGTENASANKAVAATASPAAGGSVSVQAGGVDVTEVENGTEVTFTATPNAGYDFVNWTNGGVEVSSSATYVATITATTSLVANFEAHRTAYCGTPVTDNAGGTLYLTISNPSANTYKILFEGSENNKINSDNVYLDTQLRLRNVNDVAEYHFSNGEGIWHVSSEGFGSAYITFTAANYRNILFSNKHICLYRNNAAGGSDLSIYDNIPDANLIAWDATCADDEAPVLTAPVATQLSGTSVRLTLSATDNRAALLTYSVNYKPAGSEGAGTDIEVTGTAGETTYRNIKGLSAGVRYQFTVTVSDGTNESEPQVCYATPSMPTAPVPAHNAELVRSVYSDKYESALAHDFVKNNWSWITYAEQNIGGDHLLVYTSDPAVQEQMPEVAWGENNDGANAIIAKDGFNDGTNKGLDVREMAYIHFDIWSAVATIYPEVYLNDTKVAGFRLSGSGWQSFDIPLSSLTDEQKTNVRWIKFIALRTPNPEEIAIDNVYFWRYGVKASAENWATFASPVAVKVPAGVTVYSADYTQNGNEEVLTLTNAGDVIPANEGVLLQNSDPSATYAFTLATADEASAAAANFTYNSLVGCATRTDISAQHENNDIFCLRRSDAFDMSGFFLYSGQYIPAGKAYLKLPKNDGAPAGAARRVRLVVNKENVATSVESANAEATKASKFMENGQLYIQRGEAVYTLQGTRVR